MLIDNDGTKKGVMSIDDALKAAEEANMDLVQVTNDDAKPVVAKILDYGKYIFDKRKPNGTPRKVMDVSLAANYGWRAKSSLKDSIIQTYKSYLSSFNDK